MLRIRDFIETNDKLIFSVVSYYHPKDRYIAFLRYYPSEKGGRKRGKECFQKVSSTEDSYNLLRERFPEYVFYSDATDSELQCVPKDKILRIYHPWERLEEIYETPRDPLEERTIELSEVFNEIPNEKKGVTGSLLVGLHDVSSDIDFVVYGIKNHEKARRVLRGFEGVRPLTTEEWFAIYKKRIKDNALSFEEFLWHEQRKFHKGVIGDNIFDVLLVKEKDEIKGEYSDLRFKRLGRVKHCFKVVNASQAFDYPAVYRVEGENGVMEVASYTHTYVGQAFEGERIEVAGFLEEVKGKEDYKRIVVGTTREAKGEYIKLKK